MGMLVVASIIVSVLCGFGGVAKALAKPVGAMFQ